MTNNKQMLLGLGFTGTFGANGKAWMSEDPVGEAKETADHLTEWFEAGAADGF